MAPASGVEAPIIMKLRLDSRFVPFGSTSPSIFRPDTFSRVFPLAFFFLFFFYLRFAFLPLRPGKRWQFIN